MSKDYIIEELKKQIEGITNDGDVQKVGEVLEVGDGVVKLTGLSDLMASEMVRFTVSRSQTDAENNADQRGKKSTQTDTEVIGVALNLEEDQVGVMILGDYKGIKEGDQATATGKILSIPVSEKMIGRVVNPLGQPIDAKGEIKSEKIYPIEREAAGVIDRKSVDQPVQTGIKAIDALIPIGRGQRELIIGDRQTGKTAVAIDAIINQADQDMICVYVAIGQKESKIARIVAELEKRGAMDHTIIVTAGVSESAAFSFIAPYAGTAIAEYFMDQGKDVLIVHDDLSKHAWAYRQISLILRRPPGREAYPGDIFYLHSRLLERSARRRKEAGGGSITALPIIETQASDVSAYIPTNVISITDGQIYLETDLFYKGIRPALNVGLSVSRVGSAAQIKAMKKVAGTLRLDLAQFRELEAFAQFGSDLDDATKQKIERGKRTVEILKQGQYEPLSVENQVIILYALTNGFVDEVPVEDITKWEAEFSKFMNASHREILDEIKDTGAISEELEKELKKAIGEFKL